MSFMYNLKINADFCSLNNALWHQLVGWFASRSAIPQSHFHVIAAQAHQSINLCHKLWAAFLRNKLNVSMTVNISASVFLTNTAQHLAKWSDHVLHLFMAL